MPISKRRPESEPLEIEIQTQPIKEEEIVSAAAELGRALFKTIALIFFDQRRQ